MTDCGGGQLGGSWGVRLCRLRRAQHPLVNQTRRLVLQLLPTDEVRQLVVDELSGSSQDVNGEGGRGWEGEAKTETKGSGRGGKLGEWGRTRGDGQAKGEVNEEGNKEGKGEGNGERNGGEWGSGKCGGGKQGVG